MRRWMAAPLVFAAAAAVALNGEVPRALAQPANPPTEETFQTADGVQLHGLFHKTAKDPASAPVVVLLYPPGKDNKMTKGDWEGLANRLTAEGYHVYRFDWRGHGKSTDIKDTAKFWTNGFTGPWNNRDVRGAKEKPVKNTIKFADLINPIRYSPVYLTDLAAVRTQLDIKNDANEVNTSSIYLVGAESTAALGLAWLAAEWNRPAFYPTLNQLGFAAARYDFVPQQLNGGVGAEGGNDISGAVWLSPRRGPGTSNIVDANHAKALVSGVYNGRALPIVPPKTRDANPMLFLYGDKDASGKAQAEFFYYEALVADAKPGGPPLKLLNKLDQTFLRDVKGAGALSGVALLGNNAQLKTEDTIVSYLAARQKQRNSIVRKVRRYTDPYYINLPSFGF